jgi:hypothetical protein
MNLIDRVKDFIRVSSGYGVMENGKTIWYSSPEEAIARARKIWPVAEKKPVSSSTDIKPNN